MKVIPKSRPYWFVDAKWICGLLLIITLGITFLLFGITQVTDQKHGPRISALVIGSVFLRGDTTTTRQDAVQEIRQKGGAIHPIPNFPDSVITEKDLALSDSDLKIKVFSPLTTSIYNDGIEKTAEKYGKTQEERDKFIKDASLFKIVTKKAHDNLRQKMAIFIVIAVFLCLGVVYFSAGWGRMANLGLLLVFSSFLWSIFSFALSHPHQDPGNPNAGGFLSPDIAKELGISLGHTYITVTIVGFLLLVLAGIGKLITTIVRSRNPHQEIIKDKQNEQNNAKN